MKNIANSGLPPTESYYSAVTGLINSIQLTPITPTAKIAIPVVLGIATLATAAAIYCCKNRFKQLTPINPKDAENVENIPLVDIKNSDSHVRSIFKDLQIKEWHLPGQSTNMPNKLDPSESESEGEGESESESENTSILPMPKVILNKKNQDEINIVKQMIETAIQKEGSIPNLIIEGPAGVGKTMLAQDLCFNSKIGFIRIPASPMGKFLTNGTAGYVLQQIYEIANDCKTPVYIIMDDGEQFVKQRPSKNEKQNEENIEEEAYWLKQQTQASEVIAQRLVELVNGILEESGKEVRNIGFIVTTNRPYEIDDAFRTRSTVIHMSVPLEEQRKKIMATHIPKVFNYNANIMGFFNQGRLEAMAKATEGFTGRNLVKTLENIKASVLLDTDKDITQEKIDCSIAAFKMSLNSKDKATKKAIKQQKKAMKKVEKAAKKLSEVA